MGSLNVLTIRCAYATKLMGNISMDSNNKSNWRRLKERCQALPDTEQKKLILHDAIYSIEGEHGPSAYELLYPYNELFCIYHETGNREVAALHLMRHYLILENNYSDDPDQLMMKIMSMRDMGYLKEATYACNSLLYLLYESPDVAQDTVNDVWWLLKKLNEKFPERSAKKLLTYLKSKRA